jgi:flagellar hook-basal body complex protein FliE
MQFSIDSTSAISATKAVTTGAGNPLGAVGKGSAPFSDLFSDAVGQVTQLEDEARITVDRMMTGSGIDIHQAMIATQKASMAFELALAVRNKAVQAYQSVMGMQF